MSEASDGVMSQEKPDDVEVDRPAAVHEQSTSGSTTVDAQDQGSQAGNPDPTSESPVDSEATLLESLTGSMDQVGLDPTRQAEPMETEVAAEKLKQQPLQAEETGPTSEDVGTGQEDPIIGEPTAAAKTSKGDDDMGSVRSGDMGSQESLERPDQPKAICHPSINCGFRARVPVDIEDGEPLSGNKTYAGEKIPKWIVFNYQVV